MKIEYFFIGLLLTGLVSEYGHGEERVSSVALGAPSRVMLSIPGDPSRMRAVTWQTPFPDTVSVGQITELTISPYWEENADTYRGTFSAWEEGRDSLISHKVIFDNLEPETEYAYRVGNSRQWSEWFRFRTSSDKAENFSFLYFGDLQDEIKSYCSPILRQAYSQFPESDFMLLAGDLVHRSTDKNWDELFYAGGWIWGMMPSVPTPGNHEYFKDAQGNLTFSDHWEKIYCMPCNGPSEEFNNRVYYLDYQGVRFISVDSRSMYEGNNDKIIVEWLEHVLKSNPLKWAIVFSHIPVYSCSKNRNTEKYRNAIKPVLEKYGVDLVLQGHDHTYCRGRNPANVGENCKNPPMYMVSVAGPKMYELREDRWADKVGSSMQLFQHIEINDHVLSVKTFTRTGALYDSFSLVKNRKGINKVVEGHVAGL